MHDSKQHMLHVTEEIQKLLQHDQKALYDPARYMLNLGGKHIRPLLCVLSSRLYQQDLEDTYQVAAALELFHNFSLIHDDIMDHADLRRGYPTVHKKWGVAQAILSGDVVLVEAFQGILKMRNAVQAQKILPVFTKLCREVCVGQQLDLSFEQRQEVSLAEYLEMIRLKTSVLIGGSMQLGAMCSLAGEKDAFELYSIGEDLGIAFQIQDDYLDAFGGQDFGKTTGGDITASKKTYLFVKALEKLSKTEKKDFLTLYTSSSSDKIEQVLFIFRRLELEKEVLSDIEGRYKQAMLRFEHLSGDPAVKHEIAEIVDGLWQRKQ